MLKEDYLLSDSRIALGLKTAKEEARILSLSQDNSFSLYVSVPVLPQPVPLLLVCLPCH